MDRGSFMGLRFIGFRAGFVGFVPPPRPGFIVPGFGLPRFPPEPGAVQELGVPPHVHDKLPHIVAPVPVAPVVTPREPAPPPAPVLPAPAPVPAPAPLEPDPPPPPPRA